MITVVRFYLKVKSGGESQTSYVVTITAYNLLSQLSSTQRVIVNVIYKI